MLIFSFVFPVYCSDQFRHVWLSDIRHIIVCNRINQNNVIDFHISGQSHRRMHILQNYFFFCNILRNLCFSDILKHLQWPALQQVYGIFSCFWKVHRKFDINRIFIFFLEQLHNILYLLHQNLILYYTTARNKTNGSVYSPLPEWSFCVKIMIQKNISKVFRKESFDLIQIHLSHAVSWGIHCFYFSLRKLMFLCNGCTACCLWHIQTDKPGIRTFRAVHCCCSKTHNQPQHSCFWIDLL